MEAKDIAKKLELTNRIEDVERSPAFITLKEHNSLVLTQSYNADLLTLQKANLESKQTKTGKNQQTSKPKLMEKLNMFYKVVHRIRK